MMLVKLLLLAVLMALVVLIILVVVVYFKIESFADDFEEKKYEIENTYRILNKEELEKLLKK